MRILLSPNDSLTAVMSGAAATTNPYYHATWADSAGGMATQTTGSLSGATAVTAVAAPPAGQRTVSELVIYNVDTAAVTVTVSKVVSGTSYTLSVVTLQTLDTLMVDADGISVMDSSGQLKQTATSTAVVPFALEAHDWRRTDGVTLVTATGTTTHFGAVYGTPGTDFPHLETLDGKAATTVVVARRLFKLPPNYVAGSAITIRARCGMKTTVADNSAGTTIDFSAYSNSGVANGSSADLVTTAAQSINSLTAANYDFTVTPTGLVAGQDIQLQMTLTLTDAATATAVIGTVNHVEIRTSVSQ